MRHRGCPSQRDYRRRWLSFEWERKTVRYRFDSCYLSNKQSAERTQWGRRVPVWQDGNTLRKHVRHRIRSWLWVNGHRESSSGGNTPLARRSACAAETKERTPSCQGNETLFVVSPFGGKINERINGWQLGHDSSASAVAESPWPFFRGNVSATRRFTSPPARNRVRHLRDDCRKGRRRVVAPVFPVENSESPGAKARNDVLENR